MRSDTFFPEWHNGDMTTTNKTIGRILLEGCRKGWKGYVWILKILVPVSLLTALLAWSGLIDRSQFFIQPVMKWLSLPVEAALPILIGTLTGIYGAVAAMAVLPLSRGHMTLIAVFLLIAHGLIQEGVVQGKSGLHPLKATLYRLITATLTILVLGLFIDDAMPLGREDGPFARGAQPFKDMLLDWCVVTSFLAFKILCMIMGIMMLLELARALGWVGRIVHFSRPLLKALGLSEKTGMIWITSAIFGLLYGSAVIVEEARRGHLNEGELEALHVSIGINHAMIEDPALFLALGLNPVLLWVPRLIAAALAVRVLNLARRLKRDGSWARC